MRGWFWCCCFGSQGPADSQPIWRRDADDSPWASDVDVDPAPPPPVVRHQFRLPPLKSASGSKSARIDRLFRRNLNDDGNVAEWITFGLIKQT